MLMATPSPVVLIPCFNPPKTLVDFGEKLQKSFTRVLFVDDGSHKEYQSLFDSLRQKRFTVLRHRTNRGKGVALKTGLHHIRAHYGGAGVITADADGQHSPGDIVFMGQRLREVGPRGFILGERNLNMPQVPFPSKIGNRATSLLVGGLFGRQFSDTQTGLRALGPELLQECLPISGERYEYEMALLLHCLKRGIKITRVPIETIYLKQGQRGHFRLWEDSYLICRAIFQHYLGDMGQ